MLAVFQAVFDEFVPVIERSRLLPHPRGGPNGLRVEVGEPERNIERRIRMPNAMPAVDKSLNQKKMGWRSFGHLARQWDPPDPYHAEQLLATSAPPPEKVL